MGTFNALYRSWKTTNPFLITVVTMHTVVKVTFFWQTNKSNLTFQTVKAKLGQE